MLRDLILLTFIGAVLAATLDPFLHWEIERDISTKGLKTLSNSKEYKVLVITEGKIWENPIICDERYCVYGKSLRYDEILSLAKKDKVLSIKKPKIFRPALWNAIEVIGGNLTEKNITIDNKNYTIPLNVINLFGENFTGKGVKVAIIDTGINDKNPWFSDANISVKIGVGYNFSNGSCIVDENNWTDENGHGTHVAGILHSIAPDAELIIIKLLNWTTEDVLCAINKSLEYGADIILMSLGGIFYMVYECPSPYHPYDTLCYFVNSYSESNGTVFVVAAGNMGNISLHYNDTVTPEKNVSIELNEDVIVSFLVRWYNKSVILNITILNSSNRVEIARIVWNGTEYEVNTTQNISLGLEYGLDLPINERYLYITMDWSYDVNLTIEGNGTTEIDVISFTNSLSPSTPWSTIASPGIAEKAITVGSFVSSRFLENFGEVSNFSSRGPLRYNYSVIKPEVIAPGEIVFSANSNWTDESDYIVGMAGTSMATPVVAGIAAIIKQVFPSYTPEDIKKAIILSADSNAYNLSKYSIYEKGYGLVNISRLFFNETPVLPVVLVFVEGGTSINGSIENDSVEIVFGIPKRLEHINITAINLGRLPTRNISINGTVKTIEGGEEFIIKSVNWSNVTEKNYSEIYTVNISGEHLLFMFEEFKVHLVPIANITFKNFSVDFPEFGKPVVEFSFNFSNDADFPGNCSISIYGNDTLLKNVTISIPENNLSYRYSLNITNSSGKVYNGSIEISCEPFLSLNNITITNVSIIFDELNFSIKEIRKNYSFFENVTINLSVTSGFDPQINISFDTYEVIQLEQGDYVVVIPAGHLLPGEHNLTINISSRIYTASQNISLTILKPNVTMNVSINNTRNSSYYGMDSTIDINITNMDKNFAGILKIFANGTEIYNSSKKFSENSSETLLIKLGLNETGNYDFLFTICFEKYCFANRSERIIVDLESPNINYTIPGREFEGVFYTNKSEITIEINSSDNYYISLLIFNNSEVFKETRELNKSVLFSKNVSLKYGLNEIPVISYDLANNSKELKIKVVFDNRTPQISLKSEWGNVENGSILLCNSNITIEASDKFGLYKFNDTNISGTTYRVNITIKNNKTINLSVEDLAGNILNATIHVFCENISEIYVSNTTEVNLSFLSLNKTTKIIVNKTAEKKSEETSGNKKIYRIVREYLIQPNDTVEGYIVIRVEVPKGYQFKNAILKKEDQSLDLNHTIKDGFVYFKMNASDPTLIIEFEKIEEIQQESSSQGSSSGGFGGYGGTYTPPEEEEPYFNITEYSENDTFIIEFERYNVTNKTYSPNISYVEKITIFPYEDKGRVLFKVINMTKYLDIEVYAFYEIIPENCSVVIEIERTHVVLINNTPLLDDKVEISGKTRLLFGRRIVPVKPFEEENKTEENIIEIRVTAEEKVEEKEKGLWIFILPILVILIIAIILITKFTKLW